MRQPQSAAEPVGGVPSHQRRRSVLPQHPLPRKRLDTLRFFASSTTAHGFHKLNHPVRAFQVGWLILIACAVVGFNTHLATLVIKYLDEPITTKIDPKGSRFVYPDVTVCNLMMFAISKIFDQQLVNTSGLDNVTAAATFKYTLNKHFQPLYDDIQQVRDILNKSVRQYLRDKFGTYESDTSLLRVEDDGLYNLPNLVIRDTYGLDRVSEFTADPREMLLWCSFGSLACDYLDFTQMTLTAYPSCLTFSLEKFRQRRGTLVNDLNELRLVLFTDSVNRHPDITAALAKVPGDEFNMQTNGGSAVFIHQPGTYPTNGLLVEASNNQETIIDVRYQQYTAKSTRKMQCQQGGAGPAATSSYMVVKSGKTALENFTKLPADCRVRAMQQFLVNRCGFVDPSQPISSEFIDQQRRGNLSNLYLNSSSPDPAYIIDLVSEVFNTTNRSSNGTYKLPTIIESLLDNETCLRMARILVTNDSQMLSCMDNCQTRTYTVGFMETAWPVATGEFLQPLLERWLQSNVFYLNGTSRSAQNVNREFVHRTNWHMYQAFTRLDESQDTSVAQNFLALRIRVGDNLGLGMLTEENWAYQVYDLMSDIGGILGLYLGMSLLTLCEMIELCLRLFAFNTILQSREHFMETQRQGGFARGPGGFSAAMSGVNRGMDLELDEETPESRPAAQTASAVQVTLSGSSRQICTHCQSGGFAGSSLQPHQQRLGARY